MNLNLILRFHSFSVLNLCFILCFDEFVVVLKGELVLTDQDGNSVTYKPGDMFMLPKGFVGTWDMTEEYRELIVVDTTAYYGG